MYLNLVQGSWETPEQLLLLLHLLFGLRIGLVIAPTGADTLKLVLWCCVPWAWPTLALLGDPESAEGPTGSLRPGHGSSCLTTGSLESQNASCLLHGLPEYLGPVRRLTIVFVWGAFRCVMSNSRN